jgi:hypothetical protein
MSPNLIHTPEEARQYLIEAFGPGREYRMYPFEDGWVLYLILSDQDINQGKHIGLTKLVLDARTRVITEFPSLPVNLVAQMYHQAITAGSPMPGAQIYPPLVHLSLTLARDTTTTLEYLIRPEHLDGPTHRTANYLLVIDKNTPLHEPPGTLTTIAAAWVRTYHRTHGTWPREGTIRY